MKNYLPSIILILIIFSIVTVEAYQKDGEPQPFGLNWDEEAEISGNYRVIGNATMQTYAESGLANGWLKMTDSLPSNISMLRASINMNFNQLNGHKPVTITTFFSIENATQYTIFTMRHRKWKKQTGLFSSDIENNYEMRISHPSVGSVTICNLTYTGKGEILNHIIGYSRLPNGNMYLQYFIALWKAELQSTDISNPSMFLYVGEKKYGLVFFKTKIKYYRIYAYEETLTGHLSDPTEIVWETSRTYPEYSSLAISSAFESMITTGYDETLTIERTILQNNVMPQSSNLMVSFRSTSMITSFMRMIAGGFNFIRLRIVGEFLETLSEPVGEIFDTFVEMVPIIFGMYLIFLCALLIKSGLDGTTNPIMDHFLTIYSFIHSIITFLLDFFWNVVHIVGNLPIAGQIGVALFFIGALVYVGFNL